MGASRAGVLFLALVWVLSGCVHRPGTSAPDPAPAETALADLMARRLEVARHVAWVKFQNGLPVSDPRREAELLASLVRQGAAKGLSSDQVTVFFSAQICASRRVQNELIAKWRRGGTLPAYPPWDLRRHIRPKLDEISAGMLDALSRGAAGRKGFGDYAAAILQSRDFSPAVVHAAVEPLP